MLQPADADAERYLQRHGLKVYLGELAAQLLAVEPEERTAEAVAAYFTNVQGGTHVLRRGFAFVTATPHNRRCFARLLVQALGPFEAGMTVSADQLLDPVRLLCDDVPAAFVAAALDRARAAAGGGDPHSAGAELRLHTALLAVCTQLVYGELLEEALEMFAACDARESGLVPTGVLLPALSQLAPIDSDAPATVEALLRAECGGAGGGAPAQMSAPELEARLFRAYMAQADAELQLGLGDAIPGTAGVGGVAGAGGASLLNAELQASAQAEQSLRRRKAAIRAKWARRRSAGVQPPAPE